MLEKINDDLKTELNKYSNLPDLNDKSSHIVLLKNSIMETLFYKNVYIGRGSEYRITTSFTELLDPNSLFLFWVVSTLQIMRPFLIDSQPKVKGYTVFIETYEKAILGYRVQAISSNTPINVIQPMIEAIIKCYDEAEGAIYLDEMVKETYFWFKDHNYPIADNGSFEAFYQATLPS